MVMQEKETRPSQAPAKHIISGISSFQAKVDLSTYPGFQPAIQVGLFKRLMWYLVNRLVFKSHVFPVYRLKSFLLRLFGASVGKGLVIKPGVNIKFPWNLSIGDHCWIGEEVWIDNISTVTMGNNVCLSQGVMLLTGNHDYSKTTFNLLSRPIVLEDGVWIGAKSVVCPGVSCKTHAVLTVMSVATKDLASYTIFQGNPAVPVKHRIVY